MASIEDIILETRRKLDDKQPEIEEMKKQLKAFHSKLDSTVTSTSNNLQEFNNELKVAFEDKLQIVKDKEKRSIRSIDEEADTEIQTINEKRERRIKSCHDKAEQQKLTIKENQAKAELEIKAISEEVAKKIKDLKNKNQLAIGTLDNIDAKIERIKQDDTTLANEAPQVLASLDDILSPNVHQDVMADLDRIQLEVQRVKFVEGEVGGEHYGRIDGYIGKWELVKSIHIPSIVNNPLACGLISDDEICVRDKDNNATYIVTISTEHTEEVIEGDRNMYITSCAPIDSNVIVCGKGGLACTSDNLDGFITLYDRQWKEIMNISIPGNNKSDRTSVYVDVDRDGMILAAQYDQSDIYVINPADGKIVNNITMQDKKARDMIQAFPSGNILLKTDSDKFTVISRSGEEKHTMNCDEWRNQRCRVDKLTYTLYITYWNRQRIIGAIDQVSCDGIIQAKRIVIYEMADRNKTLYTNHCFVTTSGNLVACNGDKVFVYTKKFIL